MNKQVISATALLFCIAIFAHGCVVAAIGAGAGTVAYVRGDLQTIETADIDTLYKAVKIAANRLELNITKTAKDQMSATVILRDALDKKIKIKLKRIDDENTKLSIRIGLFGDETKSRFIYAKIKENLD